METFTSGRKSPDVAYSDAVLEDPTLLLNPQVMEENGMLTSDEKGYAMNFACLAWYRYPEKMAFAQKKLIEQHYESSFQFGVNEIVHGKVKERVGALTGDLAAVNRDSGQKKVPMTIDDLKQAPAVRDSSKKEIPIHYQNPAWSSPATVEALHSGSGT
jgi:hypothetical protein